MMSQTHGIYFLEIFWVFCVLSYCHLGCHSLLMFSVRKNFVASSNLVKPRTTGNTQRANVAWRRWKTYGYIIPPMTVPHFIFRSLNKIWGLSLVSNETKRYKERCRCGVRSPFTKLQVFYANFGNILFPKIPGQVPPCSPFNCFSHPLANLKCCLDKNECSWFQEIDHSTKCLEMYIYHIFLQ